MNHASVHTFPGKGLLFSTFEPFTHKGGDVRGRWLWLWMPFGGGERRYLGLCDEMGMAQAIEAAGLS